MTCDGHRAGKARSFSSRVGFISRDACARWPSPTPFLPWFNFHEVHESGTIMAPAASIIAAVCALDMNEDRVVRVLLAIRELPAKLRHACRWNRHRQAKAPFGIHSFTPLACSTHEMSMGLVGRFWRPDGGLCPVGSAEQFMQIDDQSQAKLVVRFDVIETTHRSRVLRTETFVYCPTRRTRLLFTPYWLMIRLASGWIRRRTLASIERRLAVNIA